MITYQGRACGHRIPPLAKAVFVPPTAPPLA